MQKTLTLEPGDHEASRQGGDREFPGPDVHRPGGDRRSPRRPQSCLTRMFKQIYELGAELPGATGRRASVNEQWGKIA